MQDTSFGVPRAMGVIDLWTADARTDDRSRVLMALYDRLLEDALQEFRYPMEEAGLGFGVDGRDRGLTIRFWGYDDAQERMLADLLDRIANFEVDPDRFEVQRARALRQWRNRARERPVTQSIWAVYEALYPHTFEREVAIAIAPEITVDELNAFAKALFDELSARIFVHGNHTEEAARAIAGLVQASLLEGAAPASQPPRLVRQIGEKQTVVRDVAIDHADSTLVVVYQGEGEDPASHARWMLLGQLLDTPFFTQLRTEQQLGYSVSAGYMRSYGLPGVRMAIQSGVAGPVTLQKRVEEFIASHSETVAQMPADEFATLRSGLVAKLREADTQLYQLGGRLHGNLDNGRLTFDWDEAVAKEVEALDRDTMAAFYAEILATPDPRRLVVRSFGTAHEAEREQTEPGCPDTDCVAGKLGAVWTQSL